MVRSSDENSSSFNISSGSVISAPMPAAPTVVNLIQTDIGESMNDPFGVHQTVVQQITLHSSDSEMRVSDISMNSGHTGHRHDSDENESHARPLYPIDLEQTLNP